MDAVQAIDMMMEKACRPAYIVSQMMCIRNDLKTHLRVIRSKLSDEELDTMLLEHNIPLIYSSSQAIMDEEELIDYLETYGKAEEFGEQTLEAYRMKQFKQGVPSRLVAAATLKFSGTFWSTSYSSRDKTRRSELTSTPGWVEIGGLMENTWPTVIGLMHTVPTSKNPAGGRALIGLTARAWECLSEHAANAHGEPVDFWRASDDMRLWASFYGSLCMPALPFAGIRSEPEVLRQLELWKTSVTVGPRMKVTMASEVVFEEMD